MSKRRSIEEYTRSGQKIMAIKVYRDATGQRLVACKQAVEHFMANGSWTPEHLREGAARALARPVPRAVEEFPDENA